MKPYIRRARISEAEQVRRVLRQAHLHNIRQGFTFPIARTTLKQMKRKLRYDLYYVLVDNHTIAGTLALRKRRGQWQIGSLGVLPNFRKRGYGTKLLRFGEGRIRSLGGKRIFLLTPQKHPLLPRYYRMLGYTPMRVVSYQHIRWLVMVKK